MLIAIIQVFVFQIIVISVIVVVLKKVLEGQLITLAVQKLDAMPLGEFDQNSHEVTVTAYAKLKSSIAEKIAQIVTRKINKPATVAVQRDKKLWGGLIIRWNKGVIDFSLISRLKEGGLVK